MVAVSPAHLNTVFSSQALKLLGEAATPSSPAAQRVSSVLGFKSAESAVGSAAMAKIQELAQSPPSASPEEDAIARVKQWVKSGKAQDAAAGRADAWLQQMALDDKLGNLPPLSLDQESTLSTQELRVYVEARYWEAYYDSPRTLDQAQREYIQQTIPSFEESIGRMKEALSSARCRRTSWRAGRRTSPSSSRSSTP